MRSLFFLSKKFESMKMQRANEDIKTGVYGETFFIYRRMMMFCCCFVLCDIIVVMGACN